MSKLIIIIAAICALLSFRPAYAQQAKPVTGSTLMTVTVVLTDSTVIEIPLALEVVASGASIAITATVTQTDGLTVTAAVQSPIPIATAATQAEPLTVANRNANLRTGPGTTYAVAGNVTAGAALEITGQSADGEWLLLSNGQWIAAFLVDGEVSGADVIGPTPAPPATSRPTATPTVTRTATSRPTATAAPWYSGGTLHGSTVAEWKAGSGADKLATAADWYVADRELKNLQPSDEPVLRAIAELMVICVDKFISDLTYTADETLTSTGLLCATLIATTSDYVDLAALLEE